MANRLRPALLYGSKALEQLTIRIKHNINETSREDGIHRLPVEYQFSPRLEHLMIQPYLRRLTHTVERFSPRRWRGQSYILYKQAGENNRHHSLDPLPSHLR